MSPAAPSTAELMRRIDDIVGRLDRITDNLERSYLRSDVYQADRSADALQFKSLEDDQHLLTKRIDGLTEQRDEERDRIIDRMRNNNRFVIAAVLTGLAGPFLTLLLAHAAGVQ